MKTILVVDDEKMLRDIIQEDLQAEGFNVLTAESGNAALKIIDTVKIDFVLSDIRMPDGDGVFLLKELRLRNPLIPQIALMTGYAKITVEEAKQLGAIDILQKPYDMDKFIKVIREVI